MVFMLSLLSYLQVLRGRRPIWVFGCLIGVLSPVAVSQLLASGTDIWLPVPRSAAGDVYLGRVSRVIDGDTLWVQPLAGGFVRKLRLDGLDAPESCQRGGPASREALAARLMNQVVTVRVRAFDDYGRALARVQHTGEDVGAVLVREGHAWTYRWHNSLGLYPVEEARARLARKGIFADDDAEEPRTFRKRNGPCPRSGTSQKDR